MEAHPPLANNVIMSLGYCAVISCSFDAPEAVGEGLCLGSCSSLLYFLSNSNIEYLRSVGLSFHLLP